VGLPQDRAPDFERAIGKCATFVLVCCALTGCYAALNYRGLYADGAHYLLKIAQSENFYFAVSSRATVDILRQTPTVILRRLTDLSLPRLAQVFSASMLLLPVLMVALCWPILPANRKAWIFFPVLYLLVGASASSFGAIGEGAITAGYFWILLLLLLFRTANTRSKILFLLLCVPAFWLHETTVLLMPILIASCAVRAKELRGSKDLAFLALCAALFVAIIAYDTWWLIGSVNAENRSYYSASLLRLEFLTADHRINLPVVTGSIALLALAVAALWEFGAAQDRIKSQAWAITACFVCWAVVSVPLAWLADPTFEPFSQMQARNQSVFISVILGAVAVASDSRPTVARAWMRTSSLIIVAALCLAQSAFDIAATRRWNAYVAEVGQRLKISTGLVPWESVMGSLDARESRDWRLMSWSWTMPSMSIVLSPDGHVNSIILNPADQKKWVTYDPTNTNSRPTLHGGAGWQPFDPSRLQSLPKLRGVAYGAALLT
jgi:hypothetical protein